MPTELVTQLECKKCGHRWYPRKPTPPKVCPICKREDWLKERAEPEAVTA